LLQRRHSANSGALAVFKRNFLRARKRGGGSGAEKSDANGNCTARRLGNRADGEKTGDRKKGQPPRGKGKTVEYKKR